MYISPEEGGALPLRVTVQTYSIRKNTEIRNFQFKNHKSTKTGMWESFCKILMSLFADK
jgi:hypothetical protein